MPHSEGTLSFGLDPSSLPEAAPRFRCSLLLDLRLMDSAEHTSDESPCKRSCRDERTAHHENPNSNTCEHAGPSVAEEALGHRRDQCTPKVTTHDHAQEKARQHGQAGADQGTSAFESA
jgi:hypothetical protein